MIYSDAVQDRPTREELLAAVQSFLEMELVPTLEGTKKFHARVAVNVLAIVRRELASEVQFNIAEWLRLDEILGVAPMPSDEVERREAIALRTRVMCELIRHGDADEGLPRRRILDHVRQTVKDKLSITDPKWHTKTPVGGGT